MTLHIPDAVRAMNRTEALAYYQDHLHLSEMDARALVAETHSRAFRDLAPADDDHARIAVEIARHPARPGKEDMPDAAHTSSQAMARSRQE